MRHVFFGTVVLAASVACAAPRKRGGVTLQLAIAKCQVEVTRGLLQSGANPNALDARGQPIVRWLASGTRCSDADALAVAQLLAHHGAMFHAPDGTAGPDLLTNLAPRHLPKTLAFLASKRSVGDPTRALRAISRSDDLDSIRALLEAGADPTDGAAMGSALLDAAASGRAASVAEMMKHVADKQSPKVMAAFALADKRGDAAVTRAFTGAGMIPPARHISAQPACAPRELTSNERALLGRLGLPSAKGLAGMAGAPVCKALEACGDLLLVDCNSAADGPAYYINRKPEKLLATCGGACMRGCTNCPPKAWTCGCTR